MLTKNRRFGVFISTTIFVTLIAAGCGNGGPDPEPAADEPAPAIEADNDANAPADEADQADAPADEDSSIYSGELETLGTALKAGTGADSFSVDGTTVRLHFSEGSREDVSAHINCSAAGSVVDDGHTVILVYPDGERDCSPEDSAGEAEVADGSGAATASLTIGDHSWEFGQVVCAFGEEETGVEGAVVNFSARNGSLSLYLAAEADGNYIELSDLDDLENGVNHTTMGVGAPNPVIEVVDRSISSEAGFYSYDDTGGEVGPVDGTVTATCP